jgi:flagellar protein FliO/FliZ
MKPLMPKRGARLLCAATTTLISVAIWFSSPALAASHTGIYSFENKRVNIGSSTPVHTSSGSLSGTIVRTIVALLVVIAVIYGLSWILKQSRSGRNPSVGDGLVQIASLPLGPNRSVSLIRVGAELHLLGVAEQGINGIRVFTEEEAYELGIPFDQDDFATPGRGGAVTTQRVLQTLRRLTIR